MIKIELSEDIERAHKKYFESTVKANLEKELKNSNLDNIIKDKLKDWYRDIETKKAKELKNTNVHKDIKSFNKIYSKYLLNILEYVYIKTKMENVLEIHNEFIEYLLSKWKLLATGRISKLKEIDDEIKKNYGVIYEFLGTKEKKLKTFKTFKKIYMDYLLHIFQYENFKSADFIDFLINSDSRIKSNGKRFKYEVIKEILCNMFSDYKDIIEDNMKDVSKKDELESAIKRMEGIFSLHFTTDNLKVMDSSNGTIDEYWNGYRLLFMSGIRVCPYCNRQYITPILTSSGKLRAVFDHYLPKNRFPYFSLSLYNLIPCCNSCNSSLKGTKEFGFDDINPYEDNFDDFAKFSADISFSRPVNIKISNTNEKKKDAVDRFKNMFKLEAQYSYHNNQVEELIKKRIAYPEEYIQKLYTKYKEYFRSEEELRELIVGFKIDEKKINDEPLAKFRRDIAKQLYFFKETKEESADDSEKKLLECLKEKYRNI